MKKSPISVSLCLSAFLIGLIFGGCASEPNFPPGLPSGEAKMKVFGDAVDPGQRFDFETGSVVTEPDGAVVGDIFFDRKFLCGSGYPLNVGIQDTQPQSIGADPTAPPMGYTFPGDTSGVPSRVGVYNSHVYWIKLTDGKYAKIKIKQSPLTESTSDFEFVIFEWVYQPDGSTDFKGIPEETE